MAKKAKQVHGNIDPNQVRTRRGFKKIAIYVACSFLLVGAIYYIGRSIAAEPTTANQATSTCGARVANYKYKPPFGNAVWNQPVCGLGRHPQSADYANRFYKYSNLNDGTPQAIALQGYLSAGNGLEIPPNNWSRNIYYAKDATQTIKIQASVYESNLDGEKFDDGKTEDARRFLPNTPIPWNPAWETGQGGDNEMIILDDVSGKMWFLSGLKKEPLPALGQCGPFFRDRLCTYTASVARDDFTKQYVDYRTYEGYLDERGVGLSGLAGLVTADEVVAGEIRHAMTIAIPNTAVGPVCTKAQQGTAAEGKTCGTAIAPATKFEWGGATKPVFMKEPFLSLYTQEKLIPEGMRFALNIDDSYIENWINSRPDLKADAKKAQTARIFARALKDYGFIIGDTNGARAGIQMEGSLNPVAKQKWASVGMDEERDENILNGLITATNIYTVEAPTVTCADGTTSKYFCRWRKAEYANRTPAPIVTPTPTPTPPTTTPSPPTPPKPTTTPQPPAPTPTPDNTPQPSSPPSKPKLDANLQVGFWWEKFEVRYGMMLNFGGSTGTNGVKEYVISKNGKEIARTNSTSYQDFNVGDGGRYTYSVKAVDIKGFQSPQTSVTKRITCAWIFCSAN